MHRQLADMSSILNISIRLYIFSPTYILRHERENTSPSTQVISSSGSRIMHGSRGQVVVVLGRHLSTHILLSSNPPYLYIHSRNELHSILWTGTMHERDISFTFGWASNVVVCPL